MVWVDSLDLKLGKLTLLAMFSVKCSYLLDYMSDAQYASASQ